MSETTCGEVHEITSWWGPSVGLLHWTSRCALPKDHDSPWHQGNSWAWAETEFAYTPPKGAPDAAD